MRNIRVHVFLQLKVDDASHDHEISGIKMRVIKKKKYIYIHLKISVRTVAVRYCLSK